MIPARRVAAALICLVVAAGLPGCGRPAPAPTLTVAAAASLKPVFTAIAGRFHADNPGVRVQFDFASSADLAVQLIHGATADVFASADAAQLDKVVQAGLVADGPVDFAANRLAIVTAPGNPRRLTSFADLARPGLAVVVSPPPMPCGTATRRVEERTGIALTPVSEEPDVEDVLDKVATGQADAGLVFVTDALAAGAKVSVVEFPEAADAVSVYPIAVLATADRADLAQRFVALVVGEQGRRELASAGFAEP